MEREAVKRLFMQHYTKMQRVARTLLYDEQETEDVCQDIFESLLRGECFLIFFADDSRPENVSKHLILCIHNHTPSESY